MQSDTPESASDNGRSSITALITEIILDNTIRNPMRLVGVVMLLILVWVATSRIVAGEYATKTFVSQLIFGLAQGSIYALIALGYTLVYGILFMINFAHGEIFMSGAYIGFFAINFMDQIGLLESQTLLALLLTIGISVLTSVMVAILLERIAYRPLRGTPRLVSLITAIGASITLQQLFRVLFGASPRTYPNVHLYLLPGALGCEVVDGAEVCPGIDLISGLYDTQILGLDLRIRPIYFIVLFVAIALMTALWFYVQRTKSGKAMRAVAEDEKTAALMGINVNRVIVITFVLGAVMAGAGAVLFALYNRQITPGMGFVPGIKAFTAAVLGGIGNVPGAMFGGLFLGIIESVLPSMLGLPNQLKDMVAFGMLVLVLIFRPTGIFGEVLSEKKA